MPATAAQQMPGWNEWEAKLQALVKDAPPVMLIRAVRSAQKVLRDDLDQRTRSAPGLTPRIREVSLDSIGTSLSKGRSDKQKTARIGYGVGKRKKTKRRAFEWKKMANAGGRERWTATKRFSVTRGTKKVATWKSNLAASLGKGRQGKKSFMALSKSLKRKVKTEKRTRMKGVGIGKPNIHWAIFGSYKQQGGVRYAKNWFGTGTKHSTGVFRPYLMGLLDATLKSKGSAAIDAAELQMLRVQGEVIAGKFKSTLRAAVR